MPFWCDDTIRVHIAGPAGEWDVTIEQPWALIGQGSRSSLVLEGPGVRKRALLLVATHLGLYAMNLDRAEAPPDEPGRWIASDDPLTIGPFRLQVSLGSGRIAAADLPDLITGRSPLPIPVLHVFGDGLLKDRRRLRHPLCLVGRRPQCSLQLRGEKVSSYHAGFYWQDHRLWCFDLMSANGTLLEGTPLACSEVRLNERLEVGEFELLYYRWSPRHTTPGAERLAGDQTRAAWESNAEDAIPSSLSPGLPFGSSDTALRHNTGEGQFAAPLDEKLAAERLTFEAAQIQWQVERERMQAELARLKAEMEVAAKAESSVGELKAPGETHSATASEAPQSRGGPESVDARLDAPEVESTHNGTTLDEPPHDDRPALEGLAASGSKKGEVLSVDSAEGPGPMIETGGIAIKPGTRRKAQPRGELTSFVSGRLSDLEHTQRRRMLILWTAAVASTLAIAATAIGLWAWVF